MWREEHAAGLQTEAVHPVSPVAVDKIAFALLLVASLCPALLVRIPAMVDYPNHLARMYVLFDAGTRDANPFYETVWAPYPNLAMDLIVPRLAHLMGVETATRIFLLLSQILIVAGAMAIERVAKGRVQISGFAALMFLYCLPFAWGFLNFEFGLGAGLWGIAAWLLVQERPWPLRLAINSFFVAALFAAHFFALGVYGATIGLHELWRAWQRQATYQETALRLAVLALPAVAVLCVVTFTAGSIGGTGTRWFFAFKPLWLFHIMNGYSLAVSATGVVALIGLVYVASKRGILRLEPAGIWLAIGFACLYAAIPSRLFGTAFVDLRVIAAAAFVLPAFSTLSLPDRRWQLATLSCISGITLANLAVVLFVWFSYRADYAAIVESFRKIDKDSLVLVGHSGEAEDPPLSNLLDYPIYHAPTLAVHYAGAFVPSLFAAAGKQPIAARPAYRRLEVPYGGIVPVAVLKDIAERQPPAGVPDFIRSWQSDYDYLYVIGPRIPNPMPDRLEELDAAPRFVLYRIRK